MIRLLLSATLVASSLYCQVDTWQGVWSQLPSGSTIVDSVTGATLGARQAAAIAYDEFRGKIVIYGGEDRNTGTVYSTATGSLQWEFDVATRTWTDVTPSLTGFLPGQDGGLPAGLRDATMCYDDVRQELILFGGQRASVGVTTQVWSLRGGTNWVLVGDVAGRPPSEVGSYSGATEILAAAIEHINGTDSFILNGGQNRIGVVTNYNGTVVMNYDGFSLSFGAVASGQSRAHHCIFYDDAGTQPTPNDSPPFFASGGDPTVSGGVSAAVSYGHVRFPVLGPPPLPFANPGLSSTGLNHNQRSMGGGAFLPDRRIGVFAYGFENVTTSNVVNDVIAIDVRDFNFPTVPPAGTVIPTTSTAITSSPPKNTLLASCCAFEDTDGEWKYFVYGGEQQTTPSTTTLDEVWILDLNPTVNEVVSQCPTLGITLEDVTNTDQGSTWSGTIRNQTDLSSPFDTYNYYVLANFTQGTNMYAGCLLGPEVNGSLITIGPITGSSALGSTVTFNFPAPFFQGPLYIQGWCFKTGTPGSDHFTEALEVYFDR